LQTHLVLKRILLLYKDLGEAEWIKRVIRFEIKAVNGLVKSWVASSIFIDWSIEVVAAEPTHASIV
jgi:hypothetical protein